MNCDTQKEVVICIVGKYTQLSDSYLSVIKALKAAALETIINVNIKLLESSHLTKEVSFPLMILKF